MLGWHTFVSAYFLFCEEEEESFLCGRFHLLWGITVILELARLNVFHAGQSY